MQAYFEIKANDRDITALLMDRLLEIRVTDKPGLESDECEIRIDDRDGAVSIPPKGATLSIALGWEGKGLTSLGTFGIDEVGIAGPPRAMTIRGKPADMRQSAKGQQSAGYENTTLAAIVEIVARRHGWQAVCQVNATVPRADQVGESDLHFLTRLARDHGATATVKAGKLLVVPRGGAKASSGKALPVAVLLPAMLESYNLDFPDRSGFGGVRTKAHDPKTGKHVEVDIPNPNPPPGGSAVHTDRHVYPSPEKARAVASARMEALNRHTARGTLSMAGRADLAAEKFVRLEKFKPQADGDYLVESVVHTFASKSWTTTIEISGGNNGKANAGSKQQTRKSIELLVPPAQ